MCVSGKRVLVMGLGAFGGGAGCVQWLLEQGADVSITDLRSMDDLATSLSMFDQARCRLTLGTHVAEDFAQTDVVVVNPAVPTPWANQWLAIARTSGALLTTEIRLLTERVDRHRVIGITGTAGKSTTTAMVHHLLETSGHLSVIGGNFGGSLLPKLASLPTNAWIVLELSSAQLHWLGASPGWSPHIGAITNLAPNHLDWHGDEAHYRQSKDVIRRFQDSEDHFFTGEGVRSWQGGLRVPGSHNRRNAALAIEIATAAGATIDPDALQSFSGLPHRLAPVDSGPHPRFFDDSKSTTPESTLLAIAAFERPAKIHLIAGGYDKGVSLDPIAQAAGNLAGLYTIGQTGPHLAEASGGRAVACGTLERAVAEATQRMKDGDILLLSPGCASWDQFTDFRARGDAFARLVRVS